jgi:hypothetical protein
MISKIEQIGVVTNIKIYWILRLIFDLANLWIKFVDKVKLAWIN